MEWLAIVIDATGADNIVMFQDDQGNLYRTSRLDEIGPQAIANEISRICKLPLNRVVFNKEFNKGRGYKTVHYFQYTVFPF